MNENDKLTYMQQLAIDGEIAYALSTAPHNAEMKYRVYLILKEVREDFRSYVVESVKKMTKFPEGELERVIWELTQNEPPLWIWVERCIADLELASFGLELTNTPESRLSLRKNTAKQSLVTSAFAKFIRDVSIICSQAARELLIAVMQNQQLDFLHPVCVFSLEELKSFEQIRPPKKKIPFKVMNFSFDIKNMLSFALETEALEHMQKKSKKVEVSADDLIKKAKASDKQGFIEALDEVISSIVDQAIENLAEDEEPKEKPKTTKYVVMKRFKQNNVQIPLRDFKTKKEAVAFIKELIENFPELKNDCVFDIAKREGKK